MVMAETTLTGQGRADQTWTPRGRAAGRARPSRQRCSWPVAFLAWAVLLLSALGWERQLRRLAAMVPPSPGLRLALALPRPRPPFWRWVLAIIATVLAGAVGLPTAALLARLSPGSAPADS